MWQARTRSLTLTVTRLPCCVVGIAEDINHEVFCSLQEGQESCALHLQVTLSGHVVYDLLYKMLEGGFPDDEICCILELLDLP
jgi:hypothetical protein